VRRLIEKGLMFGNLVRVASPVLVERYGRALEAVTGQRTELSEFHIDISGYSPEIGDALGDDLYLNHEGVNRRFILLTTEQRTAPLLNAKFSTSRGILRQFIDANEAALFALTARDAVTGELVNSVYDVATPARLFDIRKVVVEADTTRGTVATAGRLAAMIDRFKTEQDAWSDDVLIAQMIGLAEETGDLTRNPVTLSRMDFAQDDYWTAHFGGVYLFRGVPHPAMIVADDPARFEGLPVPAIGMAERSRIAAFLNDNDLVEPIVKARGVDAAAILHQKMDFIVADVAGTMGEDLRGATRRDLRRFGQRHAALLPQAWQGLAALARWAEDGGDWPRIDSEHPAYFHTLRARDHDNADLVNRLLAELCPLDIRQLFICHKEAFYDLYRGWPDEKKAYVADFLAREYMIDKAGTRAALFGHEAPMEEPAPAPLSPWGRRDAVPPPPRVTDERIRRVGPWDGIGKDRR